MSTAKSLRKKLKKGDITETASNGSTLTVCPGGNSFSSLSETLSMIRLKNNGSPSSSRRSMSPSPSVTSSKRGRRKKANDVEMGIKNVEVLDAFTTIHTVEVLKRPGQTLGFYIREGDGKNIKKGVFISRIAEGSIVQKNGLLKIGDEIQEINSVNVTPINLDDVVVLMSIPKKLILKIKSRRLKTPMDKENTVSYCNPQPVFVNKQDAYDSFSPIHYEMNPEDSNDSGLSSENSIRGDIKQDLSAAFENSHVNFVPLPSPRDIHAHHFHTMEQNIEVPKYATLGRQSRKAELCVSDGEHEYTPIQSRNQDKNIHFNKTRQFEHLNSRDAYNSDSEVTQQKTLRQNNTFTKDYQIGKPMENSHEMKHWLRKFDCMSKELTSHSTLHYPRDGLHTLEDLQNYRTMLLKSQQKLQEQEIHNMESALTVDSLLQDSTERHRTDSLLRVGSNAQDGSDTSLLSPNMASTYSYLRDLPLLMRTPMKIQIDEFALYRPEHDKHDTTFCDTMPGGTMKARVYCGHGLKSSRTALRDLYCILQLDGTRKAKTMIRTGAINFDWDELFDIDILAGTSTMTCQVYNWDPARRHRLCFTGTLRLSRVFNCLARGSQNAKVALKLEPRGIIYLELSYCRIDNSEDSYLFGRSLWQTIQSEGSPLTDDAAPLIVRKSINEINQRGLTVQGLYRLCGAVKRKAQLRQEFERHPHMVDLSTDSVQDINVVAGLLKDYLRELPEPLLTEEAYQVAEKALSRDVTQKHEQDCDEVIANFLQALLPWQRGTVRQLLQHLKLVAMHSEVNRMPASNLAVCFAPVLTVNNHQGTDENNTHSLRLHIEIIKYLLNIWPTAST